MKYVILSVAWVLLTPFPSLAQKSALSAEEQAIKEVIENETRYFWARDYKNWKKCWAHEPWIVWTVATRDGVKQYRGWEAWSSAVKKLFEEDPEPKPYDVVKSNYMFHLFGNGAWVTFDQVAGGNESKEVRVLEKINGRWRILMVEAVYNANESAEGMTTSQQ